MKTIVFLHPHFTVPGGAGKVVLKLAAEYKKKNIKSVIITGPINKDIIDEFINLDYIQIKCPLSSSFMFWLLFPVWQSKINRALNDIPEKIIFPHVFPANWWAFIYKLFHKKTKCIWYCEEPSSFIHIPKWIGTIKNPLKKLIAQLLNPFFKIIDKKLASLSDNIITNSKFTAAFINTIYKKKCCIVPPGTDMIEIPLVKSIKQNYILTVGRLTKFKNFDLIINAFQLIDDKKIQLYIVGIGEEKNNLVELTNKLSLADRIIFLDNIPNDKLDYYYINAKIFILASSNEPFGLVLLESMIRGTAVIASESGGPLDIITPNKNGLFFKPDDFHDLAKQINKLLSQNLFNIYGSQARIDINQNYSWEKMANNLLPYLKYE